MTQVRSEISGVVWKIVTKVGQSVDEDEVLMILECMKMEMPVSAPSAGRVEMIHVTEGATVREDDDLVTLVP